MSTTVQSNPVQPVTAGQTNHIVSIEPVTAALVNTAPKFARVLVGAKVCVVERYNGHPVQIVTSDADVFRHAPLREIADGFAVWAGATVVDRTKSSTIHGALPGTRAVDALPNLADALVVADGFEVREGHACRECGKHDCGTRFDHERAFAAGESYWRMSSAERRACPACGGDALDDGRCISRTVPVAAVLDMPAARIVRESPVNARSAA